MNQTLPRKSSNHFAIEMQNTNSQNILHPPSQKRPSQPYSQHQTSIPRLGSNSSIPRLSSTPRSYWSRLGTTTRSTHKASFNRYQNVKYQHFPRLHCNPTSNLHLILTYRSLRVSLTINTSFITIFMHTLISQSFSVSFITSSHYLPPRNTNQEKEGGGCEGELMRVDIRWGLGV